MYVYVQIKHLVTYLYECVYIYIYIHGYGHVYIQRHMDTLLYQVLGTHVGVLMQASMLTWAC